MTQARIKPYTIETLQSEHDATAFYSGMGSIDRYIKELAHRDMSSRTSLVFVLTESGQKIIRAYYTLSSIGIVFNELPDKIKKRLPRYPQIGATLLGRLGVDRNYSGELKEELGEKPRLGEILLVDAQKKTLLGATTVSGTALLVIDAFAPTAEDLATGVKDPLGFYIQYGFVPFPGNPRRVFKLTRSIEQELRQGGIV